MKWRNHKLVTFSVVYSITGSLVSSLSAMAGSVLPDMMEIGGVVRHRTVTHLLFAWMVICAFFWFWLRSKGFTSTSLFITFFCTAGATLHVIEDALSYGGVPIFLPYGRKVGLGIYKTDTIGEELMVLGLVLVFSGFSYKQGYLNIEDIAGQIETLVNMLRGVLPLK